MTKQFTLDETTSDLIICDNGEPRFWVEEYDDIIEIIDLLNELNERIQEVEHRLKKFQSKYDKSKTDEVKVLVETENTVLLDKNEFKQYVRRHNELQRRNKRRKEKNRKYRNELKKRLREINGLKDFVQEDLSRDDKVLKGFIEEYL